ncbi:MAG: hypothetical protein GF398_08310, partial [Chitinivibrionales bacterium]|nr:hypothetical protein [Chitinivibrionales bacterium]
MKLNSIITSSMYMLLVTASVALSLEGTGIIYLERCWWTNERDGIWLVDFESGEYTQIWGVNDCASLTIGAPQLSPDGKRIAFNKDGRLFIMNNDGTNLKDVCAMSNPGTMPWSWDRGGIWWFEPTFEPPDSAVLLYRYTVAGGAKQMMLDLRQHGVTISPFHRKKGGHYHSSIDGKKVWMRIGAQTATDTGNLAFTWNDDFSKFTYSVLSAHGHGEGITLDGRYILLGTGFFDASDLGFKAGPYHRSYMTVEHADVTVQGPTLKFPTPHNEEQGNPR